MFGSAPDAFALRVTTIFRRERGQWKAVHRLGDALNAGSREALERRRQQGAM
jgi:hypothetical protein